MRLQVDIGTSHVGPERTAEWTTTSLRTSSPAATSAGIVEVSKLLGHSSVVTTQRYLDHLSLKELQDAVAPLQGGDS